MDPMAFMEAMSMSDIPFLAAFFIGLMTALSPCPMATNITAIAAIARKMKHTFLVGLSYTFGRMFSYILISLLIVWVGVSTQAISFFLQGYGEKLLGPFLFLLGILMSGIIKIPVLHRSTKISKLQEKFSNMGFAGSFLLGVIFALAFCPFSAVLFFGMMIPLALASGDGIFIPSFFAFGTGLPVILFSLILATGIAKIGTVMNKIETFDKWMKKIVSTIFVLVGLYYIILIYL